MGGEIENCSHGPPGTTSSGSSSDLLGFHTQLTSLDRVVKDTGEQRQSKLPAM